MKKIDIHCHTTNRKMKDVIPKSAFLDEIVSEMKKNDVEKTVVLATYFPHRQSGISNFRLYNWIRKRPEFMMFGSLDFEHYFYQGMNELEELAEMKTLSGIKIYTCYQEVDVNSQKFKDVINLAKRNSIPVMMHSGYSYTAMRTNNQVSFAKPVTPLDIEPAMIEYHDVNFIISHLAAPFLDELITVVKRTHNAYSDMSGLIDSKFGKKGIPSSVEEIKRFLGECGPARLLFGTDFPVQTHADSIYFVEEAMKNHSLIDKQDVYYNNARRLLK
jgi:predicted TIM-barrel fold metal-dependent hydrolase